MKVSIGRAGQGGHVLIQKVLSEGSNTLSLFFLIDEEREYPNITIPANGEPMIAQH